VKVLITGVAGFIGSNLSKSLIASGHEVIGIDNFCSSSRLSSHLSELLFNDNFSLIEGDITDIETWEWLPHREKLSDIDLTFNLACPASPPIYQSIPVQTMLTCTLGVHNVLRHAKHVGAHVVHASTSEVYGDPDTSPQEETYRGNVNSYGPRACYDEGKRAAEALCYDYERTHNVDVRIVRIFNTYGPNMDPNDGRVISNFVCQALSGQPMTVYGDGMQTRSFCYVDDLVAGLVKMSELKSSPMQPINLGNPNEFRIIDLAQKVKELIPTATIQNRPLPVDDPTQRKPNINRAMNLLDWYPNVQLDEGLVRTVEYFRKVLNK